MNKNVLTIITALMVFGNKIETVIIRYHSGDSVPTVEHGDVTEPMPWGTILYKFVKQINRVEIDLEQQDILARALVNLYGPGKINTESASC